MMKSGWSLLVAIFLVSPAAFARQVDTVEDAVRLEGWPDYIKDRNEFERRRLAGKNEKWKKTEEPEIQLKQDIAEYKREKALSMAMMDDAGDEYRKSLAEREKWNRNFNQERVEYIQEKERNKLRKFIALTEEVELDLVPAPERVPFSQSTLKKQ